MVPPWSLRPPMVPWSHGTPWSLGPPIVPGIPGIPGIPSRCAAAQDVVPPARAAVPPEGARKEKIKFQYFIISCVTNPSTINVICSLFSYVFNPSMIMQYHIDIISILFDQYLNHVRWACWALFFSGNIISNEMWP